jgi:hypothetical protein
MEQVRKDESEVRKAALQLVQDNPEIVEEIQRSEQLMDILEDRPELEEEVVELAEEMASG